MDKRSGADNMRQEQEVKHFDLSEESCKRPEGEDATVAVRRSENNNMAEETGRGPVDGPGDSYGENRVSTSLDDE